MLQNIVDSELYLYTEGILSLSLGDLQVPKEPRAVINNQGSSRDRVDKFPEIYHKSLKDLSSKSHKTEDS